MRAIIHHAEFSEAFRDRQYELAYGDAVPTAEDLEEHYSADLAHLDVDGVAEAYEESEREIMARRHGDVLRTRSMAVGDVIEMRSDDGDRVSGHLVDPIGFTEIDAAKLPGAPAVEA